MQTKMSESAAPSGSSRCVSEVDLFSDKPRVEQQDYTFAAQQKPGMLTLRLNCTFISYSYSFTSGLYFFFNCLNQLMATQSASHT